MGFDQTMKIDFGNNHSKEIKKIMRQVYDSLSEKGYDPVSQIVGYILSSDPTYITSHNNARVLITKMERDELLEEFVKQYLKGL